MHEAISSQVGSTRRLSNQSNTFAASSFGITSTIRKLRIDQVGLGTTFHSPYLGMPSFESSQVESSCLAKIEMNLISSAG